MKRFLMVLSLCVLLPVTASSQTKYRVTIGDPVEADSGVSKERREHLRKMVHAAYQKRFDAAGVRGMQITEKGLDLQLEIPRKWKRPFIESLVHAPGRLEVRGDTPMGLDWVQQASQLPEGVEIRGESTPYLWSANRSLLDRVAQQFSDENLMIVVARDRDGWRTHTAGITLGNVTHLAESKWDRSVHGGYFVKMRFQTTMVDRLATTGFLDVKNWLVILDGEVLGQISTASLATGSIELSAPALMSSQQQRFWVSQVAGRLAAPLPIPVAIVPE